VSEEAIKEPGWHWRNCRRLSVIVHFRIWPFLSYGMDKTEDVYSGDMWLWLGPIAIGLQYDHGNCSDPSINGRLALSDAEAYDRACKYEGIEQ
jgi:hypothetical protein